MESEEKLVKLIKEGNVFIYPTDTVYGLGCDATNEIAVARIKEIKGRDANKPLSIIAPSKEWIFKHLEAEKEIIDRYLPGKYTLILKKKNPSFLKYISPTDTLGVRIPCHEFTAMIQKANLPFVTTSVNLSGEKPASSLNEIKPEILEQVDVIINAGKLDGTPSAIILPDGKELRR